jgi:RNA polymerase sigma factor (sigma-70 family)
MQHEGHMARDEEFARWYHTHHDRIRALCARILRDQSAAEDMAQETLLRAWQRRDQMREEDLGAWLSVVARNLCLSAIRKDGRLIVTDELPERADHSADPAIEVGRRESRRNVRRALGKLGDRNRRVIDLREVRETNYEEIGSELGVSAEGARAIAFRARRVLREHLAAVGEGFSGVLVGIRIRVRSLRVRTREMIRSTNPGSAPAMQSGLNAFLAIGLALTTGTAVAYSTAPLPAHSSKAAAIAPGATKTQPAPNTNTDVSASAASNGSLGQSRGTWTPLVARPKVTASTWDEDQETEYLLDYNGHTIIGISANPQDEDGLEGARRQVDTTVAVLCRSPLACALIRGEVM